MRKFHLRFLFLLTMTLVIAAYLALPLMDHLTLRWFSRDLNMRDALLTNVLSDSIADALRDPRKQRLQNIFNRAVQDERLVAIGLCSVDGRILWKTSLFPSTLTCDSARSAAALPEPQLRIKGGMVHVGMQAVTDDSGHIADLILLHDLSFIERRSQDTRQYLLFLITGLGASIALITVIVAQLSWRGWISGTRALLQGEGIFYPMHASPGELGPLAADLRARLRDLEDEYRRAQRFDSEWKPERLSTLLRTQLRGDQIIVVSNREPYIHEYDKEGKVFIRRPASGLVTAIEPVMRACSGTWIAHGSGSADRQVVDARDHVLLPPGNNEYILRRLWLSEAEERGYYYGFANEGLWPLCHVAHVRPVFREEDWLQYRVVNQRFADAVIAEARSEDPVILVQDYHLALVPLMIRRKLPRATILTFWHIPWPNPEFFGICPWLREILEGMLGSSTLGFHTQFHCKNFIETVDRYLEARITYEHSTISYDGSETLVASYPISVEWPTEASLTSMPPVAQCRSNVVQRLHLPPDHKIVLGVDRFDYTKGILERLRAVEWLLENSSGVGDFTFIQVAAPTRTSLEEYQAFQDRVKAYAERINQRFGGPDHRPVLLLAEHHEHNLLVELYRAADVCMVTSLHDGMNLVCKEFVAVRDDERGVLILSRFAGAAQELREALIVNPYHVEETAHTLRRALEMSEAEQRERMASLRTIVREFNVYRWAERILSDAGSRRLRERIEARVQRHGLV